MFDCRSCLMCFSHTFVALIFVVGIFPWWGVSKNNLSRLQWNIVYCPDTPVEGCLYLSFSRQGRSALFLCKVYLNVLTENLDSIDQRTYSVFLITCLRHFSAIQNDCGVRIIASKNSALYWFLCNLLSIAYACGFLIMSLALGSDFVLLVRSCTILLPQVSMNTVVNSGSYGSQSLLLLDLFSFSCCL